MKESELEEKFKQFVQSQGFKTLKELRQTSPDFIIEKDGRKIGIELKGSRSTTVFGTALGQLLFAKFKYNVDDLWLILPKAPSRISEGWIELLWNNKISIFFYSEGKFLLFKPELYRLGNRKSYSEIDESIFNLLKECPEGLTTAQISKMLGINNELVRTHIKGPFGTMSSTSILKDKIKTKGELCFI